MTTNKNKDVLNIFLPNKDEDWIKEGLKAPKEAVMDTEVNNNTGKEIEEFLRKLKSTT